MPIHGGQKNGSFPGLNAALCLVASVSCAPTMCRLAGTSLSRALAEEEQRRKRALRFYGRSRSCFDTVLLVSRWKCFHLRVPTLRVLVTIASVTGERLELQPWYISP
jgi:hypothetical protein